MRLLHYLGRYTYVGVYVLFSILKIKIIESLLMESESSR